MTEKLIIIDYGSGNLRSAEKAFELAASNADCDVNISVSADPAEILSADRIVLPGVGAFAACSKGLRAIEGMIEALEEMVTARSVPFLGICVGMQLMAKTGIEHGVNEGLGWIDGNVVPFALKDKSLKVPHMGWNEVRVSSAGQSHKVTGELSPTDHAYFVHSYHMQVNNPEHILATVDYGTPLTAIVGRDNMLGFQFHPEKSQNVGLGLLEKFMRWKP